MYFLFLHILIFRFINPSFSTLSKIHQFPHTFFLLFFPGFVCQSKLSGSHVFRLRVRGQCIQLLRHKFIHPPLRDVRKRNRFAARKIRYAYFGIPVFLKHHLVAGFYLRAGVFGMSRNRKLRRVSLILPEGIPEYIIYVFPG